jgi:hypothetical protein
MPLNIPINQRMQDVIRRILNRRKKKRVRQNVQNAPEILTVDNYVFKKQRIPKKPIWYKELANRSSGYVKSIFLRAEKLARLKQHKEINQLFHIANDTIERMKNPPAQVAQQPKHYSKQTRYNLRSAYTRRHTSLKDFIEDYAQKIKHKKEILYKFLKRMYDMNKNYIPSSRKFAKRKA